MGNTPLKFVPVTQGSFGATALFAMIAEFSDSPDEDFYAGGENVAYPIAMGGLAVSPSGTEFPVPLPITIGAPNANEMFDSDAMTADGIITKDSVSVGTSTKQYLGFTCEETSGDARASFQIVNGDGAETVNATVQGTAIDLPLTVVLAVNDTFDYATETGSNDSFTIAPAVYNTIAAIVAGVNAAIGTTSGDTLLVFGATASDGGAGTILLTDTYPGDSGASGNGAELTDGATTVLEDLGFTNGDNFSGGISPAVGSYVLEDVTLSAGESADDFYNKDGYVDVDVNGQGIFIANASGAFSVTVRYA
jgi:hypothetical protein